MTPLSISTSIDPAQDADVERLGEALSVDDGLTGWDWAQAGIIVVASIMVSGVVKAGVARLLRRSVDEAVADLVGRLAAYTIVIFGVLYALDQVGVRIGPLLGALGIVGIALAFALRDILENFVAGLLLQFRRPFSYGDQIVSGDIEGTVLSIDARSVTVVTPDGETVHIPSSRVITDAITNHTARGSRRTTLEIGVAYGTDLASAREVVLDAVCAFAVYDACRNHGIEIPFPQRVVWSGRDDDKGDG
jgi:small conductance mechanosensitive channel